MGNKADPLYFLLNEKEQKKTHNKKKGYAKMRINH